MKWGTDAPKVVKLALAIECGPINLTITPHDDRLTPHDDRLWQHFLLSFGHFSERSAEECQETWPREAIAAARKALDDFETTLNEEKQPKRGETT